MRSLLQKAWRLVRAGLELVLSRQRLDSCLWGLGFFHLKSRLLGAVREVPGGMRMFARPEDEKILAEIYQNRVYSRAEISDGDTVVDVGAHIGAYSLYAARRTPSGRVLAVEPAPLNLHHLTANIRRNGIRNIRVAECAASDREGSAELFFLGDSALYSLTPPQPRSISVPVRIRRLDDICREAGITGCSVLKIDAEKSEMAILKGAPCLLESTRQVILEAERDVVSTSELVEFFGARGFSTEVLHQDATAFTFLAWKPGV